MSRWSAELERREADRRPARLPCVVWVGSHRYPGLLEQVSAHAVAVRMQELPPGTQEAKLTFSTPEGVRFALRAMPVRRHAVAHTLRGLLAPAVVLHLREPTDAYLRWASAPALDPS
jgi:hypothetical protein